MPLVVTPGIGKPGKPIGPICVPDTITCYILPGGRTVCPEDSGYHGIANAYSHGAPFEVITFGSSCGSPNIMVAVYAPF